MDSITIMNSGTRKQNTSQKTLWLLDILMLAVLLTAGMTSNMVTIAVVAVLGVSFCLKTPNNIIASMLFFYPFYCIFKFNGVGVSYYNVLIAVAIACLMLKRNESDPFSAPGKLRIPASALGVFALTGWCVISSFMNGANSVMSAFIDICIPFLWVACTVNRTDIDVKKAIYAFSAGCIIAGLAGSGMITLSNLGAYIDTTAYRADGVRTVRLQGLTVNPNYYSLDLNMAIAALLCFGRLEDRKMKLIEVAMIVTLTVLGIMTLSKSFLLGLACTVLLYIFINGNLRQIAGALGFGIVVVTVFVYLHAIGNEFVTALIGRFTESDSLEGVTSSRSAIWLGYLKVIFSNLQCLLIGKGINAASPISVGHASHNLYIEVLYYTGIIGGGLLLFILWGMVRRQKKMRVKYLPLGIFLVRAFAINLFVREAFMIDMIIVFLILNSRVGSPNNEKPVLHGGNPNVGV